MYRLAKGIQGVDKTRASMTLDVILNSATSASLRVRRQSDSGHQRIASRSLKNLHLRLDSRANSLAFEWWTQRAVLNETETEAETGTGTEGRGRPRPRPRQRPIQGSGSRHSPKARSVHGHGNSRARLQPTRLRAARKRMQVLLQR